MTTTTRTHDDCRPVLPATVSTPRTMLLVAAMATLVATTARYVYVWFLHPRDGRFDEADLLPATLTAIVGLAAWAAVTALFVVLPRRARRGAVDADRPGLELVNERVERVAARFDLVGRYRLMVAPLDRRITASVRLGQRGRPLVVLSGGLLGVHATDPATFDAVVAHELAHVKNRDVLPTTVAIAAWRATLLFGVLPAVYFLVWLSEDWSARTRVLALIVTVYVARVMVLRSREYWADVQARAAGYGDQVREVLERAPSRTFSWWRPIALHPARGARLRALRGDRLARYAVSVEGALLAGITLGFCLDDVSFYAMNLVMDVIGPSAAAADAMNIAPALLLVPFVWVTVRLLMVADLRWAFWHSVLLLGAFALGAAAGSVAGDSTNPLQWLGLDIGSTLLGAAVMVVLFAVVGLVALGWSAGLVALWNTAARPASRWAVTVVCALACIVTVTLLWSTEAMLGDVTRGDGVWADNEASTVAEHAAAAAVPWQVPFWLREIDTGAVFQEVAVWLPLEVVALILVVPLVVWRLRRPTAPRRRIWVGWLGFLVMAEVVNTGLALVLLEGPGGGAVVGPDRVQLAQNVGDVATLTELLFGAALALVVGMRARRGPVVLGASAGALTVLALFSSHRFVGTPLRCAFLMTCTTSASQPLWLTLARVFMGVIPGLVVCAFAAAVGCVLAALFRRFRGLAGPSGLPEPREPMDRTVSEPLLPV